MTDMTDADVAAFDAAHARLVALAAEPTVQAALDAALASGKTGLQFLAHFLGFLLAVPAVGAAVSTLDGVAATGVTTLLEGTPGGIVTGPAAGALTTLALDALVSKLKTS